MTASAFNVGAFVYGAPHSPRELVVHEDLAAAYADGGIEDWGEAYLSHFVFGDGMRAHFAASRRSVAGYYGPCCARRIVFDIDRADLGDALADAQRLVAFLQGRYPEASDVSVYFSGGRGFHVVLDLAHAPPPSANFHRVARTLAEALAAGAGVAIDASVYDLARIIRLPNTRHPKSGLFKRRIDADDLFRMSVDAVRLHARLPAGDGLPEGRDVPEQLPRDWKAAEEATARTLQARAAVRVGGAAPDGRAPRYFMDLVRFGVAEGERSLTLFRCAAWLAEQGAPDALVSALLTEPGHDSGLSPKEVQRQISCGVEHARRQRGGESADPPPDHNGDPDAFEAWAIRHEDDPDAPGVIDFPFGALAVTAAPAAFGPVVAPGLPTGVYAGVTA